MPKKTKNKKTINPEVNVDKEERELQELESSTEPVEGEKTEGIKRVTLAEQGPNLPLGILQQNGLPNREINLHRWILKRERILGSRRKEIGEEGENMARYVSAVLAVMCISLGGHKFDGNPTLNNEIIVGQMTLPDVLYAYVWLRTQSMGPELHLTLKSPFTRKEFQWVGDLNSLVIKVPESHKSVQWNYDLIEPFEIRGKTVSKFEMGPQFWNFAEGLNPGTATDATAKSLAIKSSIYRIPEVSKDPIVVIDADLDELGKRDIERLVHLIDINGVGPQMVLDVEDPTVEVTAGHKKKKFVTAIDWSHDVFFADSSP